MVKLFCAIVGVAGNAFPVDIDADQTVGDLKKAIKKENKNKLYNVDAGDLELFLAKKGSAWLTVADVMKGVSDTTGLKPFDNAGAPLHLVGLSKKNLRFEVTKEHVEAKTTPVHVLVVAPEVESKRPAGDEFEHLTKRLKLIAPQTLADFTKLSVNEEEFQLDSLRAKQNSDWPIVETPGLHTFWEGFGEFPHFYFVRMEEVVFWEVIKKLLFGKDRVVIIGSPGVGKSCFLMLIAFHLACTKNRKVLVIRRLKQREEKNAVVYFDGQGSYARLLNLSSNDILAIRSQTKGAIVLVDGFDQAQVEEVKNEYVPFSFLATSCQFDAKQDDSSRIVVLPAWRDADLLQYAKLTNWVVETGWRKTKRLEDSTWPKLVKKQYFYSGGSLREFCREREELQIRVASDCCSVKNGQAFDLVYNYGGGQSSGQVDRLRRHYITDCHEEAHYYDHRWWKLSVDSGYVLGELGRIIDSDKQLEVYQYAKSVGAGFHGVAYELLLHSAVRGAFAKRKPIVLKMREGSRYEKIEIRVPNVVCSGDDEASCYHHLSKLGKETYWHPNYPFFPFIDAVTTCKAFPGGSDEFDPIVAYIQVTIRTEKKFKQERLRRLNNEMDKNELLKGMKRAFVVVGPDSSVCKNFNLRNAPDSFLAMVGCFSPDQLKPEAS